MEIRNNIDGLKTLLGVPSPKAAEAVLRSAGEWHLVPLGMMWRHSWYIEILLVTPLPYSGWKLRISSEL